MRKVFALLSLCSLIAFFSCTSPSGVEITEYFDADYYYYRLEVSDGMRVTVTDEVDEIVITADENIMAKIEVKFRSGTLRIYRRDFSVAYINTAEVLLPINPDLKEVKVSYDSEVNISPDYGVEADEVMVKVESRSKFYGYILADKFDLDVADYSSAYIYFDVYSNMDLRIEDHSSCELDGYANTAHLVMKDHSELKKLWDNDLYAFMCDVCHGSMDNHCEAYIDAESEIEMDLTNYSFLYYTSDPYIDGSTIDETSNFYYGGY